MIQSNKALYKDLAIESRAAEAYTQNQTEVVTMMEAYLKFRLCIGHNCILSYVGLQNNKIRLNSLIINLITEFNCDTSCIV